MLKSKLFQRFPFVTVFRLRPTPKGRTPRIDRAVNRLFDKGCDNIVHRQKACFDFPFLGKIKLVCDLPLDRVNVGIRTFDLRKTFGRRLVGDGSEIQNGVFQKIPLVRTLVDECDQKIFEILLIKHGKFLSVHHIPFTFITKRVTSYPLVVYVFFCSLYAILDRRIVDFDRRSRQIRARNAVICEHFVISLILFVFFFHRPRQPITVLENGE